MFRIPQLGSDEAWGGALAAGPRSPHASPWGFTAFCTKLSSKPWQVSLSVLLSPLLPGPIASLLSSGPPGNILSGHSAQCAFFIAIYTHADMPLFLLN